MEYFTPGLPRTDEQNALQLCYQGLINVMLYFKVGWSKPPPVLISCFNRLKPPWSICQKLVNTGQYKSEWSIENSKGRFCGELRYLCRLYVLSFEKRKYTVSSLPRALLKVRFPSQDLSTEFFITIHAPNTSFSCIIIQAFFAQF